LTYIIAAVNTQSLNNLNKKDGSKLHNEELYNLYSSPNIVTVITSVSLKTGHVACIGDEEFVQNFDQKT
jgi:hypothetical protein